MYDHPYSSVAGKLFRGCRFVVYVTLVIFVVWTTPNGFIATLGGAVLMFAMHALCRPRYRAHWIHAAHLGEALCLHTLLAWLKVPAEVQLLGMGVFISANAALWGWRGMLGQAVIAAGLIFAFPMVSPAPSISPLGLVSLATGFSFALGLSLAAHHQAERLSRRGVAWREESRTLRRFLPENLPEHLDQFEQARVSRNWFCVGFVDLKGFTGAVRRYDDALLCLLLNEFMAEATRLVHAWDGQIAKFLGDGVLCVFPADTPGCQGNVAIQAVRCMRQLVAVLDAHPDPNLPALAASAGLACGECLAGEWGGAGRYDFTVIGAPVNRAQRLQSRAHAHGGLLIDADIAALVSPAEKPGPALLLNLKGLGRVGAHTLAG